jgi:AcrR family transcriptional regulator
VQANPCWRISAGDSLLANLCRPPLRTATTPGAAGQNSDTVVVRFVIPGTSLGAARAPRMHELDMNSDHAALSAAEASQATHPRRPGRPRSEQADRAIMAAALELFASHGPDGLAIEQVAALAGVGKATVYRRWPGKEDLLVDALGTLSSPLPVPQGRSVRADLVALCEAIWAQAADPLQARLLALLQGEGSSYPRLLARYAQVVLRPRSEAIQSVLQRGVATGELREDTDVDAAALLLIGAMLARLHGEDQPASRYARRVVAELIRGLAAR